MQETKWESNKNFNNIMNNLAPEILIFKKFINFKIRICFWIDCISCVNFKIFNSR